jgi:mono/diheme cytochrome c family protein
VFLRSLSFAAVLVCCSLLQPHCLAQTETVYVAQCASCHGNDGTPTDNAKSLGAVDLKSAFVQDLTNEELFNSIGRADNHTAYAHAFIRRGMTSQQIYELVKYLRQMPAEYKRRGPGKHK